MLRRAVRGRAAVLVCVMCAVVASACGRAFKPQYEYEEELYLALDGSATLNVNASIAALVALRGIDLPVDPEARIDRDQVRELFSSGDSQARVSLSRRDRRRFLHVSVDVKDVRELPRLAPFAWSSYRFTREADVFDYRQIVGASAARRIGDVGWTGQELVGFRIHVPSRIPFHNAPSRRVERGNILEWEQSLSDRLAGQPIEINVQMEAQSILSSTLLLFGSMVVAAALTFAAVIWWVARRGRAPSAA